MQKKFYEKINETLITKTLSNGLQISILPRPNFSKSFALFATNYGGADRRFKLSGSFINSPAGVAHYLEHKLFDMPNGNALAVLSANGASPNAFTSSGMTAYHFESTTGFDENLRTLLNFVSTPYFTPESVQKEQGIIGQEIQMIEDDPNFVVYQNLLRCLYASNPIRDSVAGTVESISEITDQTLYHCHEVFYNPSNMTLAVVGNVDPEAVIRAAEEILPKSGGELPERDYGAPELALPHQASLSVQMEVSAPQFLFGVKISPAAPGSARLKQMLIGEIALRVLMGASSPFFTRLYANGLLNNSFEYELDYTAGTAMVLAGGESRDVPAVMDELRSEISKISSDGIDAVLFENAKKAYYGTELRALGSFSSVAQALAQGTFAGFCPLDAFEIISGITSAEVLSFITNNLSPEKLALSVVSPLAQK
ncbi:MAG: pitrilysin family protein [Oscillospiraceae bacterium]